MALNVIFATSEARPFATTGGLADVAGSLPAALKGLGMRVTVFMPLYRRVSECGVEVKPVGLKFMVPGSRRGGRNLFAELYKASHLGVDYYFIRRDEYFDRAGLYGTAEGDYFDNLERFAFFSRALLIASRKFGLKPDIVHCNDWQTGLVPAYIRYIHQNEGEFLNTASIFTIHNLAYQGLFPATSFKETGLDKALFSIDSLEYWGKLSLLKSGIVFSDIITTVSESYAREILLREEGAGFDGILKSRKKDLFGVLNAADYSVWNPEVDPEIAANYSVKSIKGKAECRRALANEFSLNARPGVPIVAMISRLVEQKGMELVMKAAKKLVEMNIAFVLLGSGEERFEEFFLELSKEHPGRCGVRIGFDISLSHRIEAGADIFLMPSKFEPCGLNQIYSLRYGTVPVVRATGGLNDTVRDNADGDGNGYKFKEFSARAMLTKLSEAVELFGKKREWTALMKRGMREDFSWDSSARRYAELYGKALSKLPNMEADSKRK